MAPYIYGMTASAGGPIAGPREVVMRQDDAEYYRTRVLQEQRAARDATCSAACDRHQELAMMYRLRAAMLTVGPEWLEERPTTATVELDEGVSQ